MVCQMAASGPSMGWLAAPLYLAPMASLSNSGRRSSKTLRVSTVVSGWSLWYSARKVLAIVMEAEFEPRGEDWMLRTWAIGEVGCVGADYD